MGCRLFNFSDTKKSISYGLVDIYRNLSAIKMEFLPLKQVIDTVTFKYIHEKLILIVCLIKSQIFPSRPLNSMGSITESVQMI